jgi:hypothetical protein
MNVSKLGRNDRIALGAAVVVVITALLSISNDWGLVMVLSLLAGLGVGFVVLQPQLAPAMKLPMARGMTLLALGGIAVIADALAALNWIGWLFSHLTTFDAIQFIVGFIAAVVMTYAGYVAYTAERTSPAAAATPAPPAA